MTSESVTPEALDTIEARANAATEGPWQASREWDGKLSDLSISWGKHGKYSRQIAVVRNPQVSPATPKGSPDEQAANLAFIAHAREDIPALVVELRRLRTENERLEGENFDLDSIAQVNKMNFSDWQVMGAELRCLRAENQEQRSRIASGLTQLDAKFDLINRVRVALEGGVQS